MHSPATIRKYSKTLGIKLDKLCPADTHLSNKLVGVQVADKLGAYWDIVTGRKKVPNKGKALFKEEFDQ